MRGKIERHTTVDGGKGIPVPPLGPRTSRPVSRTDLKPFVAWWYVMLPSRVLPISRTGAFTLADGTFLAAFPWLGALLPSASCLIGFLCGAATLGYERAFSESLILMMVAGGLGFLSTQLGLLFTGSFAMGDFVIGQKVLSLSAGGFLPEGLWAGIVRYRLPMLIGYLLLAGLVIVLPMVARALLADLPGTQRLTTPYAFLLAGIGSVIIVAVGVYLWAAAAAVLIRPLFVWSDFLWPNVYASGSVPPAEAITPLQQQATWIVLVAVLATVTRIALLWFTHTNSVLSERVGRIEQALVDPTEGVSRSEPTNQFTSAAGAVGTAVVTTLLLSGLMHVWWVALLYFVTLLALCSLRARLLPRLGTWSRMTSRVPVLVHFSAIVLIAGSLASILTLESFTGLSFYVLALVAIPYLLLPAARR